MFWMDLFFEHFLYAAIRWIRERRSSGWPVVRGTAHGAVSSGRTAKVTYIYIVDGERYAGEHTRVFWFAESAATYTELFAPKTSVNIRYRPGQAIDSIMRSEDQGKRGTQLDGL